MRTFNKPPLTVPQQIQLLKQRGLAIRDETRAERFLEVVSLFRLSPYMRPFQTAGDPDHAFLPGSSFGQIIAVYCFDRELRNLIMDAVERFEVAVRAGINNHMSSVAGSAHWYLDSVWFGRGYPHDRLLSGLRTKLEQEKSKHERESSRIRQSHASDELKHQRIEQRRRDNYFRYYGDTYDKPDLPPSWAMLEELSLGELSRLYAGIAKDNDRKRIARRFDLPQDVLRSWLHTLTFVRNCCAHHARLWNRELSVPPKLPRSSQWHMPCSRHQPSPDRRLYVVLMMLTHLMQHVSPDSRWLMRLQDLLGRYRHLPQVPMGFPEHWQNLDFWQQALGAMENKA